MEVKPSELLPRGVAGDGQRPGHRGHHLHHVALPAAHRLAPPHQLQPAGSSLTGACFPCTPSPCVHLLAQGASRFTQRNRRQLTRPGRGRPEGDARKGTPGKGAPGKGMPGKGTPGKGTPGKGRPGRGRPGRGRPGWGRPGRGSTPGKGTPGRGRPGRGRPGRGRPGRGLPRRYYLLALTITASL